MAAFYSSPRRSFLSASFQLLVLVALLEGARLAQFHRANRSEFAQFAPELMARASLEVVPDDLVVTLARPAPGAPLQLSVNRGLPFEMPLPKWLTTVFNLVLSHMLHATEAFDVLPSRSTIRFAREDELQGPDAEGATEDENNPATITLTESHVHLVDGDTFAFEYPRLPLKLGAVLCEAHVHPDWPTSASNEPGQPAPSGIRCDKSHLERLVQTIRSRSAAFGRGESVPGSTPAFFTVGSLLLVSMYFFALTFALSDALLAVSAVVPPLLVLGALYARRLESRRLRTAAEIRAAFRIHEAARLGRLGQRPPDAPPEEQEAFAPCRPSLARALMVSTHALTLPLLANAVLEGPWRFFLIRSLRDNAVLEASQGSGLESGLSDRPPEGQSAWDLASGLLLDPPLLPDALFYLVRGGRFDSDHWASSAWPHLGEVDGASRRGLL
jgi:hypothetical protein